ncbi:MAG: ABC transporter substrate-binding protein [Deltaproteobacteria bacterium]|nr:ABC transporter substrate-binding protein [Deltaproteobacteria bacterium]
MIISTIFFKRAVSVLLIGMALFLFACQPGRTVPPQVTEIRSDTFAIAEKYQQSGDFQKALANYRIFLKRAQKDERTPLALQRMAEIHLKLKNPEKALASLETLSKAHPDYTWMPEIRYQISVILNQLGKYDASANEAIGWLDRYEQHFLQKDVLVLLGDDFCAMGETKEAFFCWIKAKNAWKDDPEKKLELDDKLKNLIVTSSPMLLTYLLESERETLYPPEIYHQMSLVFLSHNELGPADKAARTLLESTRNPHWISRGEDILAKIEKEMAICGNCIGCLLPLSGPFAVYGQEVLNGILLGMLGASMDGTKMELIVRDTAGNPEKALDELKTLADIRKVVGVIGPLSSKTAAVTAEKAQELGVPMIALTQRRDIVKAGDMVFRNFLTPAQEIDSLLELAMGQLGLERFGIFYPDNAYGRFCMNLFWDKLDELGGSVTAVETYPTDVTDFADEIKKMVGLYYPRTGNWKGTHTRKKVTGNPKRRIELGEDDPLIDFDAVFIPDTYQRVAMIAPQLAFHDVLGVRLIGTRLWNSPKLLEMTKNYIQGAVFSSGFETESENPKVMGFVADYKNNFGAIPGILAANGYDTIRLLKTIFTGNRPQTRDDLRQALQDVPAFEGVTGHFSFDAEGEALKTPLLLTISGNSAIPIY